MKKLIAGIGIAVLVFGFSLTAEAAVISGIDDSSTAASAATWLIKVLMNNKNESNISNSTVTSTSNSGTNTFVSADDQSDTSYKTGSSSAETGVGSAANSNELSEAYATYDGAANTISNVNDSSTATASSSDTLDNNMQNHNNHGILNKVSADSDSGSNSVISGDSLSGASGTTGASDALTEVLNAFNINLKKVVRTK